MTTYGLTDLGLVIPTVSAIRDVINTALRAAFGSSIDTGNKSILGQIVGIFAERIAQVWEALERVYSSQDPAKATGAALDAVSTLTGTFRPPAKYSAVVLTLTGVPATVVTAGNKASTSSTSKLFQTTEDKTITLLASWANTTGYAEGDRVTNSGSAYVCIAPGTSAGSGGPTGSDPDITDGTVHWRYMGLGTGAVDVNARASETGPTVAVSGDITVQSSGVAGWEGVINLLDAVEGSDVATDAVLRVLREIELAGEGKSPIDSIRAALIDLADVVAVTVFMNNMETVDADGMPPKSVEALVRGPESPTADFDQSIFDTLLANVAAGIRTHAAPGPNAVTGTATDSQGIAHTMKFSRPTEVAIKVIVNAIVDPDDFPTDGVDQIKQAIVDFGDAQATGRDAVASRIGAQAFEVDGVLDVTSCLIAIDPATPTLSTTIAISLRQLAVFDTSRIVVNTTPGVP